MRSCLNGGGWVQSAYDWGGGGCSPLTTGGQSAYDGGAVRLRRGGSPLTTGGQSAYDGGGGGGGAIGKLN